MLYVIHLAGLARIQYEVMRYVETGLIPYDEYVKGVNHLDMLSNDHM